MYPWVLPFQNAFDEPTDTYRSKVIRKLLELYELNTEK